MEKIKKIPIKIQEVYAFIALFRDLYQKHYHIKYPCIASLVRGQNVLNTFIRAWHTIKTNNWSMILYLEAQFVLIKAYRVSYKNISGRAAEQRYLSYTHAYLKTPAPLRQEKDVARILQSKPEDDLLFRLKRDLALLKVEETLDGNRDLTIWLNRGLLSPEFLVAYRRVENLIPHMEDSLRDRLQCVREEVATREAYREVYAGALKRLREEDFTLPVL